MEINEVVGSFNSLLQSLRVLEFGHPIPGHKGPFYPEVALDFIVVCHFNWQGHKNPIIDFTKLFFNILINNLMIFQLLFNSIQFFQ